MKHSSNLSAIIAFAFFLITGCNREANFKQPATEGDMAFGSGPMEKSSGRKYKCQSHFGNSNAGHKSDLAREDLPGLALSTDEKRILQEHRVTGALEVIITAGRGSSSVKVRVVIIQHSQITSKVTLSWCRNEAATSTFKKAALWCLCLPIHHLRHLQ